MSVLNLRLDHIPILEGQSNYQTWERSMKFTLLGEDLWKYVSSGKDIKNRIELGKLAPQMSAKPTDAELEELDKFNSSSVRAAAIIHRKLSPTVLMLVPRSIEQDPRAVWTHLSTQYNYTDINAQFAILNYLEKIRLKDASDTQRYLAEFSSGFEKLANAGLETTETQRIHLIMKGLPTTGQWGMLNYTLQHQLSQAASAGTPLTYLSVMEKIQTEARHQIGFQTYLKPGPGSEFSNAAKEASAPRKNASSTACGNCGRNGHNKDQCWEQGGGAEGQKPEWMVMRDAARKSGRTSKGEKPKPKPTTDKSTLESASAAFEYDEEFSFATLEIIEDASVDDITRFEDVVQYVYEPPFATPNETSDEQDEEFCLAALKEISEEIAMTAGTSGSSLMDSGSSSHVVRNRDVFWTYDTNQRPNVRSICQGNLQTLARGDCVVMAQSERGPVKIRLKDCLHAPKAQLDLISVGKLLNSGFHCNFKPGGFAILGPEGSSPCLECRGLMHGNLGFLPLTFVTKDGPLLLKRRTQLTASPQELSAFVKPTVTRDLWHARLGHAGPKVITHLSANSQGMTLSGPPFSTCEACIKGKHTRAPHPTSTSRSSRPLDLVHTDICGPMPVQTPHGKLYFIAFLDNHTHAIDVHLLATRDQALDAFKITHHKWERMFECKIQRLRMDNAGEFKSNEFTVYLEEHGIRRELSAPYAHQQNGKSERVMRTMQGRMRAMMEAIGAPMNLWGEAALTCAHLFMLTPTNSLPNGKTPFEMVHGTPPDISHLRVWGCRCFARVPTELQTKLGTRSRECRFMGYPDGVKGYRVRDVSTKTFFNSRDVIFDENLTPIEGNDSIQTQVAPETGAKTNSTATNVATNSLPTREQPTRTRQLSRIGAQYEKDREAQRLDSERRSAAWHARHTKQNPIPEEEQAAPTHIFNDDHANLMCEESANLSIRSDTRRNPNSPTYDLNIPPATYPESQARPDAEVWQACVDKELNTLKSMGVYELARLPANRQAVGNRWVFEFKVTDSDPIAKGRLVAKGFSQIPGIDFNKTFAPVVKASSVRLLAAIACQRGWVLECFDATRAFLWGDLDEEVYMKLPDGFVLPDDFVLPDEVPPPSGVETLAEIVMRLLKSIYGLKQASMVWYVKIRKVLERLRLKRSEVDHALFHFSGEWNGVMVSAIIALHVDDGLGGSNHPPYLAWVKAEIAKEFGIKDLGAVKQFLGVEFERNLTSRTLKMHQKSYIKMLLEEQGLSDCNSVQTPMDTSRSNIAEEDELSDHRSEYQTLIGKLLFLSICTRPDISYTVNFLAQRSSAPRKSDFDAVKRVFRYLKGTETLGIVYRADDKEVHLYGFSDSDWAGEGDQKSICGSAWFLGNCLIDWSSKKQSCVATSSTEAEYVALTPCVQSGIALKSALNHLNVVTPIPRVIWCDNNGAISLASNTSHHTRAKHIDIKYHFIRSHVESGNFELIHVDTKENCVDILTKPLSVGSHHHISELLGLRVEGVC